MDIFPDNTVLDYVPFDLKKNIVEYTTIKDTIPKIYQSKLNMISKWKQDNEEIKLSFQEFYDLFKCYYQYQCIYDFANDKTLYYALVFIVSIGNKFPMRQIDTIEKVIMAMRNKLCVKKMSLIDFIDYVWNFSPSWDRSLIEGLLVLSYTMIRSGDDEAFLELFKQHSDYKCKFTPILRFINYEFFHIEPLFDSCIDIIKDNKDIDVRIMSEIILKNNGAHKWIYLLNNWIDNHYDKMDYYNLRKTSDNIHLFFNLNSVENSVKDDVVNDLENKLNMIETKLLTMNNVLRIIPNRTDFDSLFLGI